MQKDFSLESILSVTTGVTCTNNYDDIFELAYFVFDDETINYWALDKVSDYFRDHLLRIHPDLKDVKPPKKKKMDDNDYKFILGAWLDNQKIMFGENLPVSRFGRKLVTETDIKKRIK